MKKTVHSLLRILAVGLLCLSFSSAAQAQTRKISVNAEKQSVSSVLKAIEKESGYNFFFSGDDVDVNRIVSISAKDKDVVEILRSVFAGTDVTASIVDKNIVLSVHSETLGKSINVENSVLVGRVTDKDGQPVIGAAVLIKDAKNVGTSTDVDGNFTIDAPSGTVLTVSSIGYITQDVVVGTSRKLAVVLDDDKLALDEVVVVGYGTQKKVNLTGSVSYVKFDDKINSRPLTNVSTALNGMSSGVAVSQSSGQPGTSATINVRGIGTLNNNTPLVLVDGIEWSMDNVNPADIESISILKDASSTAIYGALGANGVILITTKKGTGAPKFSYNAYVSAEHAFNKLALVNDYVTYMNLANESAQQRELSDYFASSTINMWKEANMNPNGKNSYGVLNSVAYPNTDWFDTIFNTGFAQNHHLSMSGATDKINYTISLGYLDNPGIMNVAEGVESGQKKYTFQSRVEGKAGNNGWLTLGANVQGNRTDNGMADVGTLFNYLTLSTPGLYPGGENHVYGTAVIAEESTNANNLLKTSDRGGKNIEQNVNLSGYFIANIVKGLTLEGKYNLQEYTKDYAEWGVPFVTRNFATGVDTWTNALNSSAISNTNTKIERKTAEILARYNTSFGEHDFNAIAGYNAQWYDYKTSQSSKQGMTDWSLHDLSTATSMLGIYGSSTAWRMMSFFGRLNYAFKDRYLFEANLRYDGSSQFAPDSRWGLFPSVSAGWRISEEPFMAGTKDWLSNLKIRASYGTVGNNRTDNYAWQATYGVAQVVLGGQQISGLKVTKLGNTSLEWESTTTADLGVDFGFWNDKLTGEIDLYDKTTSGILFTPALYMTMGVTTGSTENLAEVNNKGVEVSLKYSNTVGNLFYSIGGNVSFNKNVVTKYKGRLNKGWDENGQYLNNFGEVAESGFSGYIAEGYKLGESYLKKPYKGTGSYFKSDGSVDINGGPKDGMIRTEKDMDWINAMIAAGYKFEGKTLVKRDNLYYGDLIYADTNEDGNYGDSNDQDFTGHSLTPSTNFGFNVALAYKGFDFYALFSGAAGFYIYYQPSMIAQPGYNIYKYIADDHYFYDPSNKSDERTNITSTYPRLGGTNSSTSTFWECKGDYLKLKNVQLGYTIPSTLTQKIKVDKIRCYLSADNVFTISSFPGMDPELGSNTTYPIMKMYALGLQVTF